MAGPGTARATPVRRCADPSVAPVGPACTMAVMTTDWNPVLRDELAKPYWADLQQFVAAERTRATVYPQPDEVFAALHLTPFGQVKAVRRG